MTDAHVDKLLNALDRTARAEDDRGLGLPLGNAYDRVHETMRAQARAWARETALPALADPDPAAKCRAAARAVCERLSAEGIELAAGGDQAGALTKFVELDGALLVLAALARPGTEK